MTTNLQLSTTKPKNNKNKNELIKQLEQEQNHSSGDHIEGYQREWEGEKGRRVQRISSINRR